VTSIRVGAGFPASPKMARCQIMPVPFLVFSLSAFLPPPRCACYNRRHRAGVLSGNNAPRSHSRAAKQTRSGHKRKRERLSHDVNNRPRGFASRRVGSLDTSLGCVSSPGAALGESSGRHCASTRVGDRSCFRSASDAHDWVVSEVARRPPTRSDSWDRGICCVGSYPVLCHRVRLQGVVSSRFSGLACDASCAGHHDRIDIFRPQTVRRRDVRTVHELDGAHAVGGSLGRYVC